MPLTVPPASLTTVHQVLVYRDGQCVGWCQYGPPGEVATIKNPKAYEKDLVHCRNGASGVCSPATGTGATVWRGQDSPLR